MGWPFVVDACEKASPYTNRCGHLNSAPEGWAHVTAVSTATSGWDIQTVVDPNTGAHYDMPPLSWVRVNHAHEQPDKDKA